MNQNKINSSGNYSESIYTDENDSNEELSGVDGVI
jgi:hypothetical protein